MDDKEGFVSDKEIANDLDEILRIRNSFVHQYNFISTMIFLFKHKIGKNAYKLSLLEKKVSLLTEDPSNILQKINWSGVSVKGDTEELFGLIHPKLVTLLLQDLVETSKKFKNLSDYSVFSSDDYMRFNRSLIEKFGLDIFRGLSKHTIKKSYKIMKFLKYY